MKILVITNRYPPQSLGGYELSCHDVVRRWRRRGHEVSVLTTRDDGEHLDTAGDQGVHRTLAWYWSDNGFIRPPAHERLRIERANRRRLDDLVETLDPDVISIWAMGGMSMSLVARAVQRRPAVSVVGDDWFGYGPKADAWVAAWSRRPRGIGQLAAALTGIPTVPPRFPASVPVAFVSDFLRRRAESAGMVGFSTAEIVPPGIDAEDFPPRAYSVRPWRGRLLCVGRIEPRKGFDVAVRALPDLPDTTLHLVGPDDGHLGDLIELARDLGVADRLSRAVAGRDELAATYAEADALLFPSRWEEPFGLVPIEAMSQATPVIATRQGGSAEFLRDEHNCLAVPVDDPAATAAAVLRLSRDARLRERLAAGGAETAAEYDVDRYADRLESLHQRSAVSP